MNEAKYTGGEWKAHTSEYLKFATVTIGDVSIDIRTANSRADALLIAASQDLFQAATQFLASVKDGDVAALIDYYADIFGEAVAKAQGAAP